MKFGKIIPIILFLFIFLLLIGAVNATIDNNTITHELTRSSQTHNKINKIDETSTNIINETKNDTEMNKEFTADANDKLLAKSKTKDTTTVNNYKQLYDHIHYLKTQGTLKSYIINLNPKGDFSITDTIFWGDGKSQTKNLTINGNGATIDGKGKKCFLTIFPNYTLTLNNLNIINNYRYHDGGGAIFVNTDGKLYVNSCNFTKCKSSNINENVHGGAIRGGFDAKIYINNSIFKQNYATYGGGAIVIGATITDFNSNPHPNINVTTLTPTLIINNSQFIENSAGHGGAINLEEYCAACIINCTFKGNAALDSDDGIGGGICTDMASYLISINNTFQNNIAKESGGGIYNGPDSTMKIYKNILLKNQSPYGSAICNVDGSTLLITDSIFAENKATGAGGAVHNTFHTVLSVKNSVLYNNTASKGGAISSIGNNKILANDCIFNNNTATLNGGAIYSGKNTTITTTNTTFNKNTAYDLGGAICNDVNSNITTTNTTFTQNNATKNGGAIYSGKNTTITTIYTTFNKNTAHNLGGAICGDDNSNITTINTTFTQNNATKNGGAIYGGKNTTITTIYTTFNKNTACNLGGSICSNIKSNILLVNSKIDNSPTDKGSAIYNTSSILALKGTTLIIRDNQTNNCKLKIENTDTTKILINTIEFSSEIIIKGKLIDKYTSPKFNETIIVNLGQENITTKTDYDGAFIAKTNNTLLDTYNFIITHPNDNSNNNSTTNSTNGIANKKTIKITVTHMTTAYNTNKNIVITLKNDQNSPISNAPITVDLGNGAKQYITDNNGEIKIPTKGLTPKNYYTLKVTFNGNETHTKSTNTSKVVITKATPKITASKNTFKVKTKTKKYTIALKVNNKEMKGIKVYLKVKGKTFFAKTNSRGKATFKITNLNKKGKFTVAITYKGNKYYNKKIVKSQITIQK